MTLPVVWLPEAAAELKEARAWYDEIRLELGERFALAVEATVEEMAAHPMQFSVIEERDVREYAVSLMGLSSRFKPIASW